MTFSAQVDEKDLIPVNVITGTKLYTGIYYTLSMKSFPQGWITWVDKTGIFYIEVDLDPTELPKYGKGQPYEIDNQWTIIPSEKPNQFTLKNRRKSLGLLSYLSEEVGSGYQAAILDSLDDRKKMLPGGPWHNDALWIIQADKNSSKYYKLENVGKKGYKLTWTYKKYNQYNYFIQLANYDAGEDALFSFNPSAINLTARIYDFDFEEDPQDVFNEKSNQKRALVSKHRYPNDSPATITQTLEETVETKESATYSFTESFSMMYQTSIEVSYLILKASASMSFQGGFQATQTKTKENTKRTSLKTEIKIPPHTDIEASIYNVWAEDVVIPFKAKMLVTGTAKRIVADQPDQTQDGEVPGDVIEAYIRATGNNKMKIIKRTGNSILISLTGELTGNVGIESTVSTKEIKKIKPGTT